MRQMYEVYVDDNFGYMDEDGRSLAGTFKTEEEAIEKCRSIVVQNLRQIMREKPIATTDELVQEWWSSGKDPWVLGVDFSAREYVVKAASELLGAQDG